VWRVQRTVCGLDGAADDIIEHGAQILRHDDESGYCFQIEAYTLHDGRAFDTVFLKVTRGECLWCAIPNTVGAEITFLLKVQRLGRCLPAVPQNAISSATPAPVTSCVSAARWGRALSRAIQKRVLTGKA
jgi:hypothetical protein